MKTIILTNEQFTNLENFLSRVPLTGAEVGPFNQIITALVEAKKPSPGVSTLLRDKEK